MAVNTVKKSYSITSALAPVTTDDLMVDFVDYLNSIRRLNLILKQLEAKKIYEADLWRLVFSAERDVLKSINGKYLQSALAWNRRTRLPSHPTLIADLQKYIEIFKPTGWKKALLQSFVNWTYLGHQTIQCACGRGSKTRTVKLDIALRTLMRVEDGALVLTQMVGIKSDDKAHLIHHYGCNSDKKPIDGHVVVFELESEAGLTAPAADEPETLRVANCSSFQMVASQFRADKFIELMERSIT